MSNEETRRQAALALEAAEAELQAAQVALKRNGSNENRERYAKALEKHRAAELRGLEALGWARA